MLSLPEFLAVRCLLWLRWQEHSVSKNRYWQVLARLPCAVLQEFLHWRERSYRLRFRNFGSALADLRIGSQSSQGVLLMVGTLGPGGAERQAVITLLGLAQRGVHPLAMTAMYLGSDIERFFLPRLEAAGLSITELDRDATRETTPSLRSLKNAMGELPHRLAEVRSFARTLLKYSPEVAHLWLDEVNVKGGLAAVATGVPRIVLHVRSLPPYNFALYKSYMLEAYRWLAAQSTVRLVANSLAGARAYEEWIGLPRGCIHVIHNGFDFDEDLSPVHVKQRSSYRERHAIPPDATVVGTVLRFSAEKRPRLWAEIAERIARALPDAHFLMVGDGFLRPGIARRARGELAGRLHVVGYEMQALAAIASMDLFLLTSRVEGLPNVLIEAQALGVPVVTTAAGGAVETLAHGRTGWILADDNPVAAAETIVRLLDDKAWLQRASAEAPEFVRERFSVERMLDETLRVYDHESGASQQG